MASVNKVIIVGNLGKDPETRYFPSGDAVCNVSIATTDRWKDKQTGEMKEATEWHRVSFFGRLAEIAGEYLKKGSQVYVEGALRTRKYEKDGQDHYVTEIRADELKMLGPKPEGGGGQQRESYGSQPQRRNEYAEQRGGGAPRQQQQRSGGKSGFDDMDDDIPF